MAAGYPAISPQTGDRHEGRVSQGEPVLSLRVFLARELEEGAGGDKTAIAVAKPSALRAEVKDGAAFGIGCGKTEAHRSKLYRIARSAHDWSDVSDLDVIRRRQIEFALVRRNAEFQRPHEFAVFGPGNVLLEIVAHPANIGRITMTDEGRLRGVLRSLTIAKLSDTIAWHRRLASAFRPTVGCPKLDRLPARHLDTLRVHPAIIFRKK